MILLHVDFNELAGAGETLTADLPGVAIQVGQVARASDEEGNGMEAVIEAIDPQRGIVRLQVDRTTWSPSLVEESFRRLATLDAASIRSERLRPLSYPRYSNDVGFIDARSPGRQLTRLEPA